VALPKLSPYKQTLRRGCDVSDDVRVTYRQQIIPLEAQLWLVTAGIGEGSKAETSGPHRAVAMLANLRK